MPSPVSPPLQAALDSLLRALELESVAEDRYRVVPDTVRMLDRVYGGQLLAQALMAAGTTVSERAPSAMHAAFVKAGRPGQPLELDVDRVRDGGSMSTRQVAVHEGDTMLLSAIVSFHDGRAEPVVTDPAPEVALPETLPSLQDWAGELPADQRESGRHWIEHPPPMDFRLAEPPSFLGEPSSSPTRSHWMRVPRNLGDDPLLHAALLAYASDFFLLDMVFRALVNNGLPRPTGGFSLDHALWFHRPVRFDQWHLYTQSVLGIVGDRGLTQGSIHDADGNLVASTAQEVLVR